MLILSTKEREKGEVEFKSTGKPYKPKQSDKDAEEFRNTKIGETET